MADLSQHSNYKETWNRLATTQESALLHVAGYTDEKQLEESTAISVKWFEVTTGLHLTDRVLEIGCGVARVGKALAPRVAHWTGCDVSENMLGHAAQRLRGFSNVSLVPISGYDLSPIPDASQDLVYCTVVFMHLQEWDRWRYVQEAFRVLKPGGRFFCDNANIESDAGWQVFQASAALPRAGFRNVTMHEAGVWVVGWGVKE
jgi:ubiquinone/menaquinone biosynthesis C-methylase UbiE